jgi:DNA repair exonuclease SbcCD nuclease subunit
MLTILHDLHLGAIRAGGATPASAYALRKYLLQGFSDLLEQTDSDLMLLGDLLDSQQIPLSDMLEVYRLLNDWLKAGHDLYLVAGNHDLSRNSATLSSFQFLCRLIKSNYPGQVATLFEPQMTPYGYIIPHLANQDLFDSAVANVPPCDVLYLHCNYANEFAVNSDHSLNLSKEQAEAAPVQTIVIAHEHSARRKLRGKVVIPGNQLASSVSDCMEEKTKQYATVDQGVVTLHDCVQPNYKAVDWRNLAGTQADFIRVTGEATAVEASEVVTAISRFRQQSSAFVVTNAVDIAGDAESEKFAANLESVKSFDVLAALKALLTPEEVAILESLK